ncbi:MAG: acetyl-CoA carboxylase biotin carboxyl carrier protein [Chloroflexi bacterium]|jgi:acetyl-CoA carboxylase biotin carboxyl carrier protein|nr:acetyl-CoA carboxylase biotin carboxyl carrier protein [Chloroflexota bacterium]
MSDERALPAPEAAVEAPLQVHEQVLPAASTLDEGDASLLALVDRLAVLLERSDLTELEVQAGGTAIVLRRATALAAPGSAGPGTATAADAAAGSRQGGVGGHGASADPAARAAAEAPESAREAVLAPLTGIFYASPSPGSPPFVEVGREVVVGQVVGLIEAMKLFNEIKSDRTGRVVRVVAENGALVKAKHPLIEVEPL